MESNNEQSEMKNEISLMSNMDEIDALQEMRWTMRGGDEDDSEMKVWKEKRMMNIETKYYKTKVKINYLNAEDAERSNRSMIKSSCVMMILMKVKSESENENENENEKIKEYQKLWDVYVHEHLNESAVKLFIILNTNDNIIGDVINWAVPKRIEVITNELSREEGWSDVNECILNAIQCAPWPSLTTTVSEGHGAHCMGEDEEWGEFHSAGDRKEESNEYLSDMVKVLLKFEQEDDCSSSPNEHSS